MKTSRRLKKQRQFFDVIEHPLARPKRFFPRFSNGFLVNLRPHFFRRFPLVTASGILIIFLGVFLGRGFFIKAESATFYPQTCLGTWQNTLLAQGEPESIISNRSIDGGSGAIYPGSREDIFCGSFIGSEMKELGAITHAGVTFIWRIGEDIPVPSSTPGVFLPESVIDSTASSSSDQTLPEELPAESADIQKEASEVPGSDPAVKESASPEKKTTPVTEGATTQGESFLPLGPTSESTISTESTPATPPDPIPAPDPAPVGETSLLRFFTSIAHAEEDEDILVSTSNEIIPLGPPIQATIDELSSSSQNIQSLSVSSTETSILTEAQVIPPDEHFLLVRYSFDSSHWIELGRVNKDNWRQMTFPIPVSSWQDLRRLQISIQGISTTMDPLPPVILDGILLEVHYEKGVIGNPVVEQDIISVPAILPVAPPEELQAMERSLETQFGADIRISPAYRDREWIVFNVLQDDQYDVYLKNEATNEVRRLTETLFNEAYPIIRSGQVAWAYAGNGKRGEVMLYDIASAIMTAITDDQFVDELPSFDEQGVLSWQKTDAAGVVHQFRYDQPSRTVIQVDSLPFVTVPPPDENDE